MINMMNGLDYEDESVIILMNMILLVCVWVKVKLLHRELLVQNKKTTKIIFWIKKLQLNLIYLFI